jgi:NTE family protein
MTKTPEKKKPHKEPNIFQVMLQSVYIATYSLAQTSSANADIVIEPDLSDIGAGDFNKTRELLKRGREAGQKAIPEIKRKLAEI